MTSLVEDIQRTAFHDSTLEKCWQEGDSLQMSFQDILFDVEKEEYYSATVILGGVREIRRLGKPVTQLIMEGDGEVLQFHKGEGRALLLIEWHTYQPNTTSFAKYEIGYDTASVSVEKQDGLSV